MTQRSPKSAGQDCLVHATSLVVGETGILVTGPSGSGKSRIAMDLLQSALSAGTYAALIADDQTVLSPVGSRVMASAPETIGGLIEVRGSGIIHVPSMSKAIMHCALAAGEAQGSGRLPADDQRFTPSPELVLPLYHVVPGQLTDAAQLLERLRSDRLEC